MYYKKVKNPSAFAVDVFDCILRKTILEEFRMSQSEKQSMEYDYFGQSAWEFFRSDVRLNVWHLQAEALLCYPKKYEDLSICIFDVSRRGIGGENQKRKRDESLSLR